MEAVRRQLRDWIDADQDRIVGFLSGFLRAKSPNPPGDTREACAFATALLAQEGLSHRIVAAREDLPNIVASVEGTRPGRHLVLNGHMDVFPAIEDLPGERSQWSGDVEEGRIYGRGASDMKCGTTASLFTFLYLSRLREHLKGRLTLTVVSDEETGGRWGTRHLMETIPEEVLGDCCLNGEPSGAATVRFAEKGTLRLVITIRTPGAHGAYPHLSASAVKIAGRLMGELEEITELRPDLPERVAELLASPEARRAMEESLGAGAPDIVDKSTVNIGVIRGGLKINILPDECVMEVEIRVPPGLDRARVMETFRSILARHPEASFIDRPDHSYDASWCDPDGGMALILQDNVQALRGVRPPAIVSLGGSDARYWRWRGVPAYLYGPSPKTMGRRDEHVTVEEMMHVLRVHALSAFDYLTR
ncbi:M20/M25/M40 family metallo-hydrolase [Muricoccus radiodurans]|uniref:M20/M25/M40 family metallo-hydrolase n=1 Tax=Muricoccus radiodurans TaxID=2231721 RepID=UPI003CEC3769